METKITYKYYNNITHNNDSLKIGEHFFRCRAFENFKKIDGAYIYIITIAHSDNEYKDVSTELDADFEILDKLNKGREILKKKLSVSKSIKGPFGPGFYGMSVDSIKDIVSLVDAKSIGVTLNDMGCIVPAKTCVGIYLVGKEKIEQYKDECIDCSGNEMGCEFCEINKKGNYGIAFDIGTTVIKGALIDLDTGNLLNDKSIKNPQIKYGMDVVSRLSHAEKGNLSLLQDELNKSLNLIMSSFSCKEETIKKILVCGNTVMSYFFNGCKLSKDKRVSVVPNIAGYVGGDITAGLLASNILEKKDITVFVDIGTNGEIAVTNNGKLLVCSTAAGPAFEGASIYQGMSAVCGAICSVKINERNIEISTIDKGKPIGICGSGFLEAISEMIKNGIIDRNGKLCESGFFANRIRERNGIKEFVLIYNSCGEDIVVTQKDIREAQLAKAAIYAGIFLALKKLKINIRDINRVIIAGNFGKHISEDSLLRIGLIPKVESKKIVCVGNLAMEGTITILKDFNNMEKANLISECADFIELANTDEFAKVFLEAMNF